jgi:hypothetical protein
MIRFQVMERDQARLYETLVKAMREGELRTFRVENRGRRVVHVRYPGRITWSHAQGVIDGTVISPKKYGNEWQIFSALIGRLAQRYAGSISGIIVQFPEEERASVRRRPRKRARRRAA